MTQFSYDVVDHEYGDKLLVQFDYDPDLVSAMKTLPWEETHRAWSDDFDGWVIDWTEDSIALFEQRMNVVVPPEHKPGSRDAHAETIEFIVPQGYSWFFVQNPTQEVDDYLFQELRYFDEAYKDYNSEWVDLYDRGNSGAPVGLLDRAVELVQELGHDTEVEIEGDRSGAEIDLGWEFPHELRSYQAKAVDAVLENRGGIVSLPTGTGKTVTCMKALQLEAQKSLVLVHTKELLYQWQDEVEEALDVECGIVGDGHWREGEEVTVAIVQTLMERGTDQLSDDYGVLVFDECHRTSAADQMHQIGMNLDVDVRIGLSATPWRSTDGEELKIEGAIGGVVHEVTAAKMIDEGYLAEPEFEIVDPGRYGPVHPATRGEQYHDAYRRVIELSPTRNEAVATQAKELAQRGYKVLVNVDRIKQGKLLEFALSSKTPQETITEMQSRLDDDEMAEFTSAMSELGTLANMNARFVSSGTDDRTAAIQTFEDGDLDIMISTLLQEGVDIPDINAIVLAQAGKSDIQQIQTIGRALRPSNGDHAKIVDFEDAGMYFKNQFEQRMQALDEYYGPYGPGVSDAAVGSNDSTQRDLTSEPPETFDDLMDN
jgi:superfamily II DNA or RNA helicase